MKIGISTACYYPMKTEEALAAVVEGGAECTEIFLNAYCEMSTEFIRSLKSILASGQTAVTSIHPFTSAMEPMLFFGDYPRRFADGLENYRRYCQIAAELGGSLVVLHGAFANHPVSYDQYAHSFGKLHEMSKTMGVRIAQENVGRCMSRDPALFYRLRQDFPDVAFVLDIKQTLRGIGNLDSVMDAMGENIAHLHFSDGREGDDCLPMGQGNIDFHHLMDRLSDIDYNGGAVLELYRQNYTDDQTLWDSVQIMKNYITERIL